MPLRFRRSGGHHMHASHGRGQDSHANQREGSTRNAITTTFYLAGCVVLRVICPSQRPSGVFATLAAIVAQKVCQSAFELLASTAVLLGNAGLRSALDRPYTSSVRKAFLPLVRSCARAILIRVQLESCSLLRHRIDDI
jgi:hypothetical protein